MKFLISLIIAILLNPVMAKEKRDTVVLRVAYFNSLFGHIHRNPSKYSESLSTISCGYPVRVLKKKVGKKSYQEVFNKSFSYISVGPYKGYVDNMYLSGKKPNCFQDKYPRFFDHLELDLTEMFYWGKLYDQYEYGKSKVQ